MSGSSYANAESNFLFWIRWLFIFSIFSTLLLFAHTPARAQNMDAREIAKRLQQTYEKATDVVADFKQTTTMKFSSRIRHGNGTMIFAKPGRMRWDYLSPDYQVLISDGKTISMYFEKSNQMIISNAKEYLQSDVTYSFFAGTGDILRDFDVSTPEVSNNRKDSFLIKLTPKSSQPQVASILAWVTNDTFLIDHLQIVDHFDTVTDLFFSNIQINSDYYGSRRINDQLFTFLPPADTEIIQQY